MFSEICLVIGLYTGTKQTINSLLSSLWNIVLAQGLGFMQCWTVCPTLKILVLFTYTKSALRYLVSKVPSSFDMTVSFTRGRLDASHLSQFLTQKSWQPDLLLGSWTLSYWGHWHWVEEARGELIPIKFWARGHFVGFGTFAFAEGVFPAEISEEFWKLRTLRSWN
jgi:hypothetical protein